jgi:hypothetical protein
MTLVRTFAIASLTVPSTARRAFARVEKISLSSKLDGEREDTSEPEDFAAAKLARTRLSRNDTADIVSERDEQRLVPAFVAQVLGQLTRQPAADAFSALLAYRQGLPQIMPVFDGRA